MYVQPLTAKHEENQETSARSSRQMQSDLNGDERGCKEDTANGP
jgi:hypothetical protein